ncbi:hypothetical protein Bbelb_427250 [Branchiostoma belcheri]|nr:hypothetical protein Bbelb_427250 [Branchiostoma belcheri]
MSAKSPDVQALGKTALAMETAIVGFRSVSATTDGLVLAATSQTAQELLTATDVVSVTQQGKRQRVPTVSVAGWGQPVMTHVSTVFKIQWTVATAGVILVGLGWDATQSAQSMESLLVADVNVIMTQDGRVSSVMYLAAQDSLDLTAAGGVAVIVQHTSVHAMKAGQGQAVNMLTAQEVQIVLEEACVMDLLVHPYVGTVHKVGWALPVRIHVFMDIKSQWTVGTVFVTLDGWE